MVAFRLIIATVPVLAFLTALVRLDTYRLVRLRAVIISILIGAIIAGACLFLNRWLMTLTGMEGAAYARWAGPILEETLKTAGVAFLMYRRRIGFMVDGAIHGFAIGAGFAVVENIYSLGISETTSILLWVVRGFGTAGIHGTATAVFAIISKTFSDRANSFAPWVFAPGFLLAVMIHAGFNHFLMSPMLTTITLVAFLPAMVVFAWKYSEMVTRRWLGLGLDTEMLLLEAIQSGRVIQTPVGRFLDSLRHGFPGEKVADMLCLLQIHLELAIGAKGILLMRSAGIEYTADPEIRAKLEELRYLEKSLGRAGLMTIRPFLRISGRDLWQLYMLESM